MTDKPPYKLGSLKHSVDERDYIAESILPTEIVLPKKVDLRKYLPPVFNQGKQGSCSACAAGAQKEIAERLDYGFRGRMAYQYIYNLRKNSSSEGMAPRDTMSILIKYGCVEDFEFPYGTKEKPSIRLIEKGQQHTNKSYAEVHTLLGAKKALYQAQQRKASAIYIACMVFNYGPRFWVKREGEELIGGHAVVIVGYNDDTKEFLLRNSWGKSWCDDGYTVMSYSDFETIPVVKYTILDDDSPKLKIKDKINLFFYKSKLWIKSNKTLVFFICSVIFLLILGLKIVKKT